MDAPKLEGRYERIGFGGAFARQFRLLWMSRRPLLLLAGLLGILALAGEPWTDNPLARFLTVWPVWLIFIGPVWAFAVFHNEGPSQRHYHWSQPVGRTAHALARVAAGLAWLWLVYGLLLGAAALMGALDGDAWQLAEVGAAGWVNVFTGPLLGYLAVSLLTLPSDYPIRWFFGLVFLVPLLISLLGEWVGAEVVRTLVRPLGDRVWGLGITIIGGLGSSVARIQAAVTGEGLRGAPGLDLGVWGVATGVWVVVVAALVGLLAVWHPDRRPRVR